MRTQTKLCLATAAILLILFLIGISSRGQRYLIGAPSADHWQRDDQYMGAGLAPYVYCLAPCLDRVDARRDATPPGSLSTQPVATRWLSHESTNRMQFHVRCLPARPASAFAVSADEQKELYLRAASTGTEWNHAPYRRHAQCHAATRPPSNGATCRSAAPWKACSVFLVP
jgi:hypothetical protein